MLHLAAGVELLLKERLREADWPLLFDDIEAADELKLASGDFIGVGQSKALKRLRDHGVTIAGRHKRTLRLLRQKSNRIKHFAVIDSQTSVETVTARALGFALDFVSAEIEEAVGDREIGEYLETLRNAVTELDAFVQERWEEIRSRVDAAGTAVIVCFSCGEEAVLIDDDVRCEFCGASSEADDAVHRYASEVLGMTLYEAVKDGGEYPVSTCPSCEYETLVDRGDGERPRWFCTTCGETWKEGQLDECLKCRRFHSDNGMSVCDECFEEQLTRDRGGG